MKAIEKRLDVRRQSPTGVQLATDITGYRDRRTMQLYGELGLLLGPAENRVEAGINPHRGSNRLAGSAPFLWNDKRHSEDSIRRGEGPPALKVGSSPDDTLPPSVVPPVARRTMRRAMPSFIVAVPLMPLLVT